MCLFCEPDADLRARIFYRSPGWYALLAAPANLPGHAIVAAESRGSCPTELTADVLAGFDRTLADVAAALRRHYAPARIVFASLRLVDPHIHVHVFAVSAHDEARWRAEKGVGYEKGRFFEFLGDQERVSSERHDAERRRHGWDDRQQRAEHTGRLLDDVAALRRLTASA